MVNTKQVIVIISDLKMSVGKLAAQASHASMAFMLKQARAQDKKKCTMNFSQDALEWMRSGQTKVCLKINTEEELLDIVKKAKSAGLEAHTIVDSGRTEFDGQPTITCAAIGPNKSIAIDKITKHLKLY